MRISRRRLSVAGLPILALIVLAAWFLDLLPRQPAPDVNTPAATQPGALVERPLLELPAPAEARAGYVRVYRVVDGDTLVLPGNERLRLIGVNTDEVPHEQIDPQSFGWRAALWLEALLKPDAQVRLEYDTERTDKFGRTLAYAYLPDGRMINEMLLAEGWAKTLRIAPNTRHARRFAEVEREAKAAARGRWTH